MKYAVGIDLGGTSVKYAVVNSSGKICFSGKLPSRADESAEAVLEQIICGINSSIDYAKSNDFLLEGVGIGTPGVVSADCRVVIGGAENIVGWENVHLAQKVEQACGLPTFANNDANMMAYGECQYGAAAGDSDVVFITVGTGIGGGMLIAGELFRGYNNRGMELGHIAVKSDGEKCACGGVGCLEHYASTAALIRSFEERSAKIGNPQRDVDGELIVAQYRAGDPIAVETMEEHWNYLAHGVASMINLFSPQKIVIGGGISEAGAFYIDKIREKSMLLAMEVCSEKTEIVAAQLGNKAGSLGAAGLVFNKIK